MDKFRCTFDRMVDCGVIAVLRTDSPGQLVSTASALAEGGIVSVEVTMTTPGALDVVREAVRELKGGAIIGVGSVLDAQTARAAILAGAEFVVSPILDPEMILLVNRYGKVSIPGAFTPTEILEAWEAGADAVKIFPASVGGPDYLKAIKGPLPQVKLVPTGGVTLENAGEFIKAGAEMIAAGGNLAPPKEINAGQFTAITDRARKFVEAVAAARSR
ncbi:MAG: bifunctional 4-hydroxy-2-oxoglutarate aldolase/2-dehydro-3-deoxy-phosphogluconate aldolase [bacterium]|nr:bifunctional 4-hydroxy-2-oxoglutarate aldolase/2-dehydro-3-deoxy-phosphogluconate aldolase [bacterium]